MIRQTLPPGTKVACHFWRQVWREPAAVVSDEGWQESDGSEWRDERHIICATGHLTGCAGRCAVSADARGDRIAGADVVGSAGDHDVQRRVFVFVICRCRGE